HTGLRHPRRLAGIMALSAYLLLPDDLEREASDANTNLSIFQAHGTFDPVVRHEWAVDSREVLRRHGYAVEWHDYRMMHQVCLEEIRDIGLWLQSVLI
ncbi:MAG: carboxylesterase, partial [Acidobacteriota bacterium]